MTDISLFNDTQLIRAKLQLECVGITDYGSLTAISGSTCDDPEKLAVFKLLSGEFVSLWRDDISNRPGPFPDSKWFEDTTLATLLNSIDVRRETWYYFDSTMTGSYTQFSDKSPNGVHALGDTPETLDTFAVLYEGNIISKAWSVRRNDRSAEVAVETVSSFRRMGYGRMVVTAWAMNMLAQGKIPFYAHRPNMQSQKLAESLGAIKFADVVSYQ